MKNKILTIPYVKELRKLPFVKSASDAILMQLLETYFKDNPEGFSFYIDRNSQPDYIEGESMREVLGFSEGEFRTAFGHIGCPYKSRTIFNYVEDKFKGKYYASYIDRTTRKTFFFRNHQLLDLLLNR